MRRAITGNAWFALRRNQEAGMQDAYAAHERLYDVLTRVALVTIAACAFTLML